MKRPLKKLSADSGIRITLPGRRTVNIIGLNSGTSGDGLDAVLAEFGNSGNPAILHQKKYPYPERLTRHLTALGESDHVDGIEWLKADAELGDIIGRSAGKFLSELESQGYRADLIASHGQTVRHLPLGYIYPLSLQIGDPSYIAGRTRLPVIYDFRKSDLASGGEGAPLSPLLHEKLFRDDKRWRAIVNIGGIANITVLPPKRGKIKPFAADCGPGNMPIDLAVHRLFGKKFDKAGKIAATGRVNSQAVSSILKTGFFKIDPPKSTGRELFGQDFVSGAIESCGEHAPEDIIATITEITTRGIVDFIIKYAAKTENIYLCGGGAKNNHLVSRLKELLPDTTIGTTADLGFDPDYLEALLWAYLAFIFINQRRIDAGNFTGAKKTYIPGRLCLP